MPNLGAYHPQVVHFVVATLFLGLPIYWLGFLKRPAFFRPMASVLLLVGSLASFAAVRSGIDAHGPAERLPDTREVVEEHEELGIQTRNVFAAVLALELAALALAWRAARSGSTLPRRAATALRVGVGLAWGAGAFLLYETGEHGGVLVYEYAGGVGYRTGNPADVERLLRAGLYAQSRADREAGRLEEAARLVEEMTARFPESLEVRLLGVESLILDRKDARSALAALDGLNVPADNPRLLLRKQTYAFDAYMLLGLPDSARIALEAVPEPYRESRAVAERRAKLGT